MDSKQTPNERRRKKGSPNKCVGRVTHTHLFHIFRIHVAHNVRIFCNRFFQTCNTFLTSQMLSLAHFKHCATLTQRCKSSHKRFLVAVVSFVRVQPIFFRFQRCVVRVTLLVRHILRQCTTNGTPHVVHVAGHRGREREERGKREGRERKKKKNTRRKTKVSAKRKKKVYFGRSFKLTFRDRFLRLRFL